MAQCVCINLHDQIGFPEFLIFPLFLVNAAIVNIFVFSLAAGIHNQSASLLQSMKRRSSETAGKKGGIQRREICNCTVLKIKFGSNFIDRATPLILQNFCLNQTMSLTLANSRKLVA